jgi:mono/diheme cytochrome c family protein
MKLFVPLMLLSATAGLAAFVMAASSPFPTTNPDQHASAAAEDPIARGKHLVTIMGCADCHTPLKLGANGPEPDMSRWLSGHPDTLAMPPAPAMPPGPWGFVAASTMTAWSGPWGTSFTANLTPDPETGLGKWTFEQFRDAIRSGRHEGRGRPILPPMPWMNAAALGDGELHDVFDYLRSIPAVVNHVPQPIPPAEMR